MKEAIRRDGVHLTFEGPEGVAVRLSLDRLSKTVEVLSRVEKGEEWEQVTPLTVQDALEIAEWGREALALLGRPLPDATAPPARSRRRRG